MFPKSCVSFDDIMFMVDPRYRIRSRVGRGAQGVICSAIDTAHASKREIAIKKLPNALDEVMASKRLLRELRLLRHLKHENILSLTDIMLPPSTNVLLWKDVYIVSELMDTDLNYVISSGQELSRDHVQYFTAQLLNGISYLHRCSVVHRDLKPGNILIDRDCHLKICDFGLARSCSKQSDADSAQLLTMYVTTRWYRSPELLCFNVFYGSPIDMWSIGCIIAELFLRRPLFQGTDPRNQLEKINATLGHPCAEDVQAVVNEGAHHYLQFLPDTPERLASAIPTADEDALDLIRRLLAFNPSKRLVADDALMHPFVRDEPRPDTIDDGISARMASEWLTIAGVSMLPKEQLQNLIFQEMLQYHPEVIELDWGAAV